MRKQFMFLILLILLFTSGCKPIKKISDTTTKKATTIGTTTLPHTNKIASCVATYPKYWNISDGMTYSAVVGIIGCEGILQTDSTSGGVHRQSYYWYGETAEQILAVSFVNGVANGVSQYNLDKNIDTSNYTRTTVNIESFEGEIEAHGETIYEPSYDPKTGKYYDPVSGLEVEVIMDPNFKNNEVDRSHVSTGETIYEPSYDPKTGKYYDPISGEEVEVIMDPEFKNNEVSKGQKPAFETVHEKSWDAKVGKYYDPKTGKYDD